MQTAFGLEIFPKKINCRGVLRVKTKKTHKTVEFRECLTCSPQILFSIYAFSKFYKFIILLIAYRDEEMLQNASVSSHFRYCIEMHAECQKHLRTFNSTSIKKIHVANISLILSAILKSELHYHSQFTLQIKQIASISCIDEALAICLHSARLPWIRVAMTNQAAYVLEAVQWHYQGTVKLCPCNFTMLFAG